MKLANNKNILVLVAAVIVVIAVLSAIPGDQNPLGGIDQGQEYTATTTTATNAATKQQIKTQIGNCVLGSIVVSSTTDASIGLLLVKNATSSTDTASTTLATFDSPLAVGTYVFDVACPRGLILEVPTGFDGAWTTTYR